MAPIKFIIPKIPTNVNFSKCEMLAFTTEVIAFFHQRNDVLIKCINFNNINSIIARICKKNVSTQKMGNVNYDREIAFFLGFWSILW